MNRWHGVNLTLALLVGFLLAVHLWPGTQDQRPLTDLDPEAVSSIRIERGKRLHLELQRDAGAWKMTHPRSAPAAQERVRQLLAIMHASVQQEFEPGELADFGLDPPSSILQLDGQRLQFGDRDPGQNHRYVLVDGRIRVIDDVYFNLLSLPPGHFAGD